MTFGIEKAGMESDGMLVQDTEEVCRASGREVYFVWRKQVWSRLVREHVGFDMVWRLAAFLLENSELSGFLSDWI